MRGEGVFNGRGGDGSVVESKKIFIIDPGYNARIYDKENPAACALNTRSPLQVSLFSRYEIGPLLPSRMVAKAKQRCVMA